MDALALAVFELQTPQNPAPTGDGTTATTAPASGPGGTGAEAPPPSPLNSLMSFLPFVMIIVIFYFVMIGPERKQRKKREAMLAAVKKGDKVLTTGGMYASVAAVNEDSITLQATDDVRLRFSRQSIAQVLDAEGSETSAKS
jgi:preprotein translocase subunit YajC